MRKPSGPNLSWWRGCGSWAGRKSGDLRAPAFLALREDARPEDCRWEGEVPAAPAVPPAPDSQDPPARTHARAKEAVVRAPALAGKVLSGPAKIEAELSSGKQETIVVELEGKRFRLTHLNKVYFPESGYTKRDLLAYYYRMADIILPFLKDRPLVLRRYPDGITGQAFFQKDVREGVPDWLETIAIPTESERQKRNSLRDRQRPGVVAVSHRARLHRPQSVVEPPGRPGASRLLFLRSRSLRRHGIFRRDRRWRGCCRKSSRSWA